MKITNQWKTAFAVVLLIVIARDPSSMTVNATCTMGKIVRQSFFDLEQGIGSPEHCDDGTVANKACFKLNQTFYKHFRTLHGLCNNLQNPMYGSKDSKLSRFLPAEHKKLEKPTFFEKPPANNCVENDCGHSCQKESEHLPKPRQVSLVISEDENNKDTDLNNMAVFFGQFLDHDISLSPEHEVAENCCNKDENGSHKDNECMEIELPPNDPFYSPLEQTCIHLTRSEPHCSSGFPPGLKREQQTLISSFLDNSNVYGSDAERSRRVRTMEHGKLKVTEENNLLPEEELQKCNVPIAGDARAMENPNLASLHTLFVREHNRISEELWNLKNWKRYGNEDCDNDRCDELLFQNTRRILVAQWQNIIYSEWLPQILGTTRMDEFNLNVNETSRYDNTIDPSVLASFSTAAFRFGHSMIDGMFTKKNPMTDEDVKKISLSDTFFTKDEYQGTGMESLLAGLGEEKAQSCDRFVSKELTNFLFKPTGSSTSPVFGQDLVARNIARGRDHGIPSLAKFYSKLGPKSDANRNFECWGNIPETFDNSTWELLKKVYIHPKDIDLFVGGLVEKNTIGGGVLGYTFGWIVAEQFRRLKYGDRFFFTHTGLEHSFATTAIDAIRERKLSDVICDNTNIQLVGSNAFLATSPRIQCSDSETKHDLNLADIDLLFPGEGEQP